MSKWERKKRVEKTSDDRFNENDREECDSDEDSESFEPVSIDVRICLWEFGQNDPKRFDVFFDVCMEFHFHIIFTCFIV
jgi:hypothetical protein